MSTPVKTSTIVAACAGAFVTGVLAYAVYFDHRRRTDPDFRKALKRESKKQARAAKEEAEAAGQQQKKAIREAVDRANDEGFPSGTDEVEKYFMEEIAQGETMIQEGADPIESALCFYRALKVYPNPRDLINIYDKTVPKPILDILAEMIAVDSTIRVSGPSSANSVELESENVDD